MVKIHAARTGEYSMGAKRRRIVQICRSAAPLRGCYIHEHEHPTLARWAVCSRRFAAFRRREAAERDQPSAQALGMRVFLPRPAPKGRQKTISRLLVAGNRFGFRGVVA